MELSAVPKLTKKIVDGLTPDPAGTDVFVWDIELRGFGVRVKPSGASAYLVQYRTREGRTRRLTLGKTGVLTPEEARKRARLHLVAIADGGDPSADRRKSRDFLTVADVCDQ